MSFDVRAASDADLDAILAIYNHAVLHTTASYDSLPRSAGKQRDWFAAKQAAGHPVLVAQQAGEVVGYASYGPFRAWDGYRFTVEHSVYAHEKARRQGIASALLRALVAQAQAQQLHLMVGAIDAANTGSIELHRRLGFEEAGVLREAGYKFGRWLDLLFMTKKLA